MRGLLKALVIVTACVLMLPGAAVADLSDDTVPSPAPTQPTVVYGEDFLGYAPLGEEHYLVADVSQPSVPYRAPTLRYGGLVPLDTPRSLTVYRGGEVIISVPAIVTDLATLDGDVWRIDPSGVTPAWIANRGSMIGTAMSTAIIAGHNVYGGVTSPFYYLSDVRPGDMIDVTLRSGKIVRFQTFDGAKELPKTRWQRNSLQEISLQSCSPDGKQNIEVQARAVSL